jgi:pyridoxamine 5'-phosphate oxidase
VPEPPGDIEGVWQWVLERLKRAPAERDSPLRLMTLSTIDSDGRPRARYVVLRSFDPVALQATFYADARSPKLLEIQHSPAVALTFFDPVAQVQIRAAAQARRRRDPDSRTRAWRELHPPGRLSYASLQAPGHVLEQPFVAARDTLDADTAYRRFAIVDCDFDEVDYLHLREGGHQRAAFARDRRWRGQWQVP